MKAPLLEIKDFLKERDVEYKIDVPFSEMSFVKLGGICELTAYPENEKQLTDLICAALSADLKFKTVGKMTNILPPDGVYSGLIIKTDKMKSVDIYSDTVYAECGRTLSSLASILAEEGLSSIEELSGIPGSVGGAVFMNAGAYGKEISDSVSSVRIFDAKRQVIRTMGREELDFSYRHSIFSSGGLYALSAAFECKKAPRDEIFMRMSACAKMRRESQPISGASLGSVFKKSGGRSAAMLIDKCALKGARVGGAYVSFKHAGFIINDGGASSEDYRSLVRYIKSRVFEKFGILLEEEIEYLDA